MGTEEIIEETALALREEALVLLTAARKPDGTVDRATSELDARGRYLDGLADRLEGALIDIRAEAWDRHGPDA